MPKFGGEKALTKQLHDELKCSSSVEGTKVEVTQISPTLIVDTLVIAPPCIVAKPKKVKVRTVKEKMTIKKSRLDVATSYLYDLDDSNGPEKCLNIDLGLYQMEDL
ncbi:MAG: hypothetical protein WC046_09700 [Candidatus Bathyarchaeia archaeon]